MRVPFISFAAIGDDAKDRREFLSLRSFAPLRLCGENSKECT